GLYIRFKLKVAKAKEMRLDTIPELITELEGYRKQLSKSYLVDKEVNDRLVVEVFERM
ncbi:MAG TPA: peptidylprolyl isomerase, partial [Saprospirales bacterium]|nr:peptidylprolyl isomerase [Saprospirales bacterium]